MSDKKTAVEGGIEIVRTVSVEEWQQMLVRSTETIAEASATIAEFAAALSQSLDDLRENVAEFQRRWGKIDFTG